MQFISLLNLGETYIYSSDVINSLRMNWSVYNKKNEFILINERYVKCVKFRNLKTSS